MNNELNIIDDFEIEQFEYNKFDELMSNLCFPILCREISNPTVICDNGTGFFINNEGLFLSAAHNFKKKDCVYTVYYGENEYLIEEIIFDFHVFV